MSIKHYFFDPNGYQVQWDYDSFQYLPKLEVEELLSFYQLEGRAVTYARNDVCEEWYVELEEWT